MAQGKISSDEFLDLLEAIFDELDAHEEQLRKIELSEAEERALGPTIEAAFEGIELFQNGLERMGKYAEEPAQAHLDEGFAQVVKGAEKLSAVKPPG